MRGPCHLEIPSFGQNPFAVVGLDHSLSMQRNVRAQPNVPLELMRVGLAEPAAL
jgi:hypothetical protein